MNWNNGWRQNGKYCIEKGIYQQGGDRISAQRIKDTWKYCLWHNRKAIKYSEDVNELKKLCHDTQQR